VPRQLRVPLYEAMLKCTEPHTEAPDRFITWSAFSIVGAVLKSNVFIKDGLFTLYPNQYIILVSPPGIGKGTAINFSWGLIRETSPNYLVNIVSDRVTAPRILERIAIGWNSAVPQIVNGQVLIGSALDHTCTICSTELRVLTSASDWMLEFLCESWDKNEYEYDTKNKGSAFIKEMCTSLIGATVPDYLRGLDNDTGASIKGGFTSRCLFVFEDTPARYLPFPPPLASSNQSSTILTNIKADLAHIARNLKGEFNYNAEAKIKFEAFLKSIRANSTDDNEPLANFKARIRAHILKLAMVISACRKDALVIDGVDMDTSIMLIKRILVDLEKVFRGSGESELAGSVARVTTYIEKVGMASKKELMKALHRHITIETLDRILYMLDMMGTVIPTVQGKTTYIKHLNGRKP